MRAEQFSNPSRESPLSGSARPAELVSELPSGRRVSALRGLLIAAALATPFWLVIYLLLR